MAPPLISARVVGILRPLVRWSNLLLGLLPTPWVTQPASVGPHTRVAHPPCVCGSSCYCCGVVVVYAARVSCWRNRHHPARSVRSSTRPPHSAPHVPVVCFVRAAPARPLPARPGPSTRSQVRTHRPPANRVPPGRIACWWAPTPPRLVSRAQMDCLVRLSAPTPRPRASHVRPVFPARWTTQSVSRSALPALFAARVLRTSVCYASSACSVQATTIQFLVQWGRTALKVVSPSHCRAPPGAHLFAHVC
jgi:hypothetical protein